MTAEVQARSRIRMKSGVTYMAVESAEQVLKGLEKLGERNAWGFIEVMTTTGQTAFPPERAWLGSTEIETVQEVSRESWVWQKQADEQHYARLMEGSSGDRIARAQEKLAATLAGDE